MTVREVKRKLRAWEAGRPLPRYESLHHAVQPADQTMVVSFVRMAGESRPWGIAWGTANEDSPRTQTVPDGRVRDDVSGLVADFAEHLLQHMGVHNWTYDAMPEKPEPSALRQLWLPNGQHTALLHQMSYTYSQTKFGGEDQEILQAFGRLAGWMFRDQSRTGNQHVVDASKALREAYAFPAQDVRLAHLGYLLGWLEDGSREERLAASQEAESLAVAPTLDPTIDRDQLAGLVEDWQAANRSGPDADAAAIEIADTLRAELSRRWDLTKQAYQRLADSDRPINPGVAFLVKAAHAEFWYQHQRIELGLADPSSGPAYVAHPETDFHGSAAASRYLQNAASDEAYSGHLIHHDAELFQEALDVGKALQSTVMNVEDRGEGRSTRPVWTVRIATDAPHRLREGGRLRPYGSPGNEVTVLEVRQLPDALEIEVEFTGGKTKPLGNGLGVKAAHASWQGEDVAFVASEASSLTRRRSSRVWAAQKGPGAWLTHSRVPDPVMIVDDSGDTTAVIVDDVAQIEDGAQA